ncbi:MAG: nuclear transport factor 2 family protein [Candidatus Rariloculaceae bacterium]
MSRFFSIIAMAIPVFISLSAVLTPAISEAQSTDLLLSNAMLDEALADDDARTVDQLLDPEFTWVFKDGSHAFRSDVVRLMPVPGTSNGEEQEIMERIYGKVGVLQVFSGTVRGLRVWANRPDGWRLVHINELDVSSQFASRNGAYRDTLPNEQLPDCVNPCTIIPNHPSTPGAQAAMESWQGQEIAAASMNMSAEDGWAYYVADENVGQFNGRPSGNPKQVRIDGTYARIERGVAKSAQSTVLQMKLVDLDDAVVMVMIGQPLDGKPFYASRVLVKRGGRYQMAASYHTDIQAAPRFRQMLE